MAGNDKVGRPFLYIRRKHILFIVIPYAEYQAHGHHIPHKRTSSITDKWKWNPRNR